jgi:hypothetical protein
MGTRKTRALPARLEGVRRRFEHWRRTRKIPSRIPDSLWAAAARLAGTYGISRVAAMLRVNYTALKQRVTRGVTTAGSRPSVGGAGAVPAGEAVARFVELASPVSAGACECTLELENAGGAKMRVHLQGVAMPDLAAISRSFWNPAP